jgi:hypothetical protein
MLDINFSFFWMVIKNLFLESEKYFKAFNQDIF